MTRAAPSTPRSTSHVKQHDSSPSLILSGTNVSPGMSNSSRNDATCSKPTKGRSKLRSWYTMSLSKYLAASALKSAAPCTSSHRYATRSLAEAGWRLASPSGAGGAAGGFATALRSRAVPPPGLNSGSAISRTYTTRPSPSTSTNVVPRRPTSPPSLDLCHVNPAAVRPSHARSTTSREPHASSRRCRAARCANTAARPTMGFDEKERSSHSTFSAHAATMSRADQHRRPVTAQLSQSRVTSAPASGSPAAGGSIGGSADGPDEEEEEEEEEEAPAGGRPLPLSRQTTKYCSSPGGPVKLVVRRQAHRNGTSRSIASSHIHRPTKRSHASTCAHSSVTKFGFSSMLWNPSSGPVTAPFAQSQGAIVGSNTAPNLAASSRAPG